MKKWMARIYALCMVMLVLPMAAVADTTPTVTLSFDKSTVHVGEKVIATYHVTGDGEYAEVMWQCSVDTEDGVGQGISSEEVNVSENMEGSFSIIPGFGTELKCSIYVKETNGRWHNNLGSWKIPITGSYSYSPQITLTLDKDTASIGERVTANYEVSGDGQYDQVMWQWGTQVEDGTWQGIFNEEEPTNFSDKLSGVFSIVPQFGQRLRCSVYVRETSGRSYSFNNISDIPITGYIPQKPEIHLSLDKSEIAIGEKVTAVYSVEGDIECKHVFWAWSVKIDENEGQDITEPDNVLEGMSGSFSITPRFGQELKCILYVVGADGRTYESEHIRIPIAGFTGGYDTYKIIKGADTQITTGAAPLTFCADGDFDKFLDIQVDSKYVPKSAYTAWSGSTYVELSADYLNTLSDGQHELTVIFDDGIAVTDFTVDCNVDQAAQLPQTGDHSQLMMWLMILSACSFSVWMCAKRSKAVK